MISIQSAMLVALGFLAASLLGLLLASALWSRAVRLTTRRLKAALPGWEFQYESDWHRLLRGVSSVGRRGELHRMLLYAVLTLLIVESVLAWRFGHHTPARA